MHENILLANCLSIEIVHMTREWCAKAFVFHSHLAQKFLTILRTHMLNFRKAIMKNLRKTSFDRESLATAETV